MNKLPFLEREKYHIPKGTRVWSFGAGGLALVLYIVMLIVIGSVEKSTTNVPYYFFVIRDVALVVTTILLTTVITGSLIEVRSRNEIYRDAVFQDIIANPAVYSSFSDETKQMMLKSLENELLFGDNMQIQQMYSSIKEKLSQVRLDRYYYESCNYHITCSIDENATAISKVITRTIKLRSYDEEAIFNDFKLLCWSGDGIDDPFSIQRIELNGKLIDSSQYVCERITKYAQSDLKPPQVYYCTFRPELHLYSDRETTISIVYTSKVIISDNNYTCRSSVPCKHFSVDFQLQTPGYRVNAAAFGFLDKAKKSPISVGEREVRVAFDDWVYSEDGVSISIAKKI